MSLTLERTEVDRYLLWDVENYLQEELGVDAVSIILDYSGRGMMGRRCVGFACDDVGDVRLALERIVATQAESDPQFAAAAALFASTPSVDALGLALIAYWPEVPSPPNGGPAFNHPEYRNPANTA